MKRMIDDSKIKVNKSGKIEITDAKFTNEIELPSSQSAKKIYCHPISILNSNTTRISCLIFNNDATPFTKETFLNWLDALYTEVGEQIRILASGAFYANDNDKMCITSYLGKTSTQYYILGVSLETMQSVNQSYNRAEMETFISVFYDGVNTIN